jgi:site-specific recombinase XerD
VSVGDIDIEAFLATEPTRAAHRLSGLRRFFRFTLRRHLILTDPTKTITIAQPQGLSRPHPHP